MSLIRSETRQESKRQTAELVKLLTEIGPDIAEIARRLGQFKESVRYRYKEKILKKGFSIHANVNHESLGLKRRVYVVDVDPYYEEYIRVIFSAMNRMCYLVGFSKTIPDGRYILHESIPEEFVQDVYRVFQKLEDEGLFSSFQVYEFDNVRHVPMRADYYDFDTGRWEFDWSSLPKQGYDILDDKKQDKHVFDYSDLLIIKELQIDANRRLVEISRKLGINYKKLAWHYKKHVIGNRLVTGYRINWLGTRYDYRLEKAMHRKHRYVVTDFMLRSPGEQETMRILADVNRIPFVWGYAVGKDLYFELAIPFDMFTETLQYVERCLRGVKCERAFYIIDQTNSLSFTIPYTLFDQEKKNWTFNSESVISSFKSVILKIREGPA
jgi:DNA-binding Lrp family transcriptional regulator